MKKVLRKNNLVAGILVLVVVCLGIVLAGDVIVKEGVVESVNFQSTGCAATGTKAVAFGYKTEASGDYSTAMGVGSLVWTEASGYCSTAIGMMAIATGDYSTAIGSSLRAGSARCTTAIGKSFTNDVQDSFAVGYFGEDFRVVSGLVTVHNNLYVNGWVSAEEVIDRSSFYDKDTYGRALDYLVDSSKTIKVNPEGEKEYNHEVDPEFVQRWITLKDYDKYTEEEVWDDLLEKAITNRIYETHQELGSSVTMKLSWLTQCVFELKQENQALKDDIAKLKDAVGIE